MIFGRHDLVRDPPISRVDLLIARNTLMYFNPELQARILGAFHFALSDGGFLFLGKSEMLLTRTKLFVPVDLKRRVFEKIDGGVERPPRVLPVLADAAPRPPVRRVDPLQEAFEAIAGGGLRRSTQTGCSRWRTSGRGGSFGSPSPISGGPCRTWSSRIGRSSCARASRRWTQAEPAIVTVGRRVGTVPAAVSWFDVEVIPARTGDGEHRRHDR